jgi:hypothetical protein
VLGWRQEHGKGDGMNAPMPKWVLIISLFIAALGLFVGMSLYVSPATFIKEVDFSSKWVRYLTNMWAARQIAIAAIIGYSLVRRSGVMLKVSLIAYLIMNIQDVVIGLTLGDLGLIVGASIATVLSGSMIMRLSRNDAAEATPRSGV